MAIDNKQFKAFIQDAELVDAQKLEQAFALAEKEHVSLEGVLAQQKLVTPAQMAQLRAYVLGIPFVNISDVRIDPEVLKIIPEPIARKHKIIAYHRQGKALEVAMLNPEDIQTIDFIRKKAGLKIMPRLTTEEGITIALKQYEATLEAEFQGLIQKGMQGEGQLEAVEDGAQEDAKDLQKAAEELPTIRIVDAILKRAISQRASDIHIEPEERDVVVRYRIDGILHDAMTLPKEISDGMVARIKVLSNLRLDEHRLPQDGRFTIQSDAYKVSFRVSVLPVFDGEKVVMRLLPENSKGFTLEELGFWGEALEHVQHALRKPTGMFLVTGPTGSGKTTTLYTALDILNTPEVNISTIEDPIEYRMPRINQTQVRPEIEFTFANGLRALVRQDPDILMVGEIRDSETAHLAINAALTGHMVLSTLHTNSAAGTLPRLIEMGQEPFLIASTINLITAQRLVRTLCSDTREKHVLTKAEYDELASEVDLDAILELLKKYKLVDPAATWDVIPFYKAKGSDSCPDGYRGRVGIHEVLPVTETIKQLISSRVTATEIHEQARKEGMVTMLEDGVVKAVQGITTLEEVLRVTSA
ncbi:MAG: ATPase, T2SS/T4P/T4SS family [Candidatus Spechtbacterales bacterium]